MKYKATKMSELTESERYNKCVNLVKQYLETHHYPFRIQVSVSGTTYFYVDIQSSHAYAKIRVATHDPSIMSVNENSDKWRVKGYSLNIQSNDPWFIRSSKPMEFIEKKIEKSFKHSIEHATDKAFSKIGK